MDTYGGMARHGGGAFSGKDPTKVDRSASYMARYVAKNIVAAGLCERCEVQVAYAIGIAKPVSLYVSTFETGKVPDERIEKAVSEVFDLTPQGIITHPGPAEADLQGDLQLRALRPGWFQLGEDRQGGGHQGKGGVRR